MIKIIAGRTEIRHDTEVRILLVEMSESDYHQIRKLAGEEPLKSLPVYWLPLVENDESRRAHFDRELSKLKLRTQVIHALTRGVLVPYENKPFPSFDEWAEAMLALWERYGEKGHWHLPTYRNFGKVSFCELIEKLLERQKEKPSP